MLVASLGLCVCSAAPAATFHRHSGGPEAGGKSGEEPKPQPSGPLILAVSISDQRVTVYDNGKPIASSSVSTGMSGHATPMGVFSVIQKQRWHHSNLYSNAPMPFMQRITWSGVALHAGVVPGYPASHGCIRLPPGFAVRLWGMTKVGARVVIARGELTPREIEHPHLAALLKDGPQPKSESAVDDAQSSGAVVMAAATGAVAAGKPPDSPPAKVAGDAPEPPAHRGGSEGGTDPAQSAASAEEARIAELLHHPGQLSLFISRREGKLFVRKGFSPVFDVPITVAHPEMPIGTHVFTASRPAADGGAKVRWLALTLTSGERPQERTDGKRKGRAAERPAEPPRRVSAADALDRIELPPEVLDRIAPLVVPGTSLLVSDQGLGGETGKDTDFIVVTSTK